jgi:hypothetical protein
MKKVILTALLVLGTTSAMATVSGDNSCQGNCPSTGGGTTTNSATGGAGGTGGTGVGVGIGMGGAGGTGIGYGGTAVSGSSSGALAGVVGSGNSSNTNANSNRNSNTQGQAQGQSQTAKGGNASQSQAVVGSGNSHQGQSQSSSNDNRSSASNSNSNANSGNNSAQSVTVNGDTYQASKIPVATAYAPNIAPTAVCMGSTSAGVQGMSVGVSIGSSWTDKNCMLLEQVRTTAAVLGDKETAAEMMCSVDAYREARARTGKPCGGQAPSTTSSSDKLPKAEPQKVASAEYTDPIVRSRLGLAPLK